MDHDDILRVLAPCGLNCAKCLAFVDGDIAKTASELQRLLGNFDTYARRFSSFKPVFDNYPPFKELLQHFTQASCRGCRQGDCLYPNCGVTACARERGVDFCFQCPEFPCEKTNFDPDLKARWLHMNSLMREQGIEAYFEATRNAPRYI
ncbi:MAG: hypothetical protein BWK76_10460 [Desulfobulbaceae bacterium A2]|nr:MAG: hypothetical protein BWK76_10460 [Desulfobulbaceae bacterium A2]